MKKTTFLLLFILLHSLLIAQSPLWLRYPAISPDGKKIAFCFQGKIFTVSSKGGVATPIVDNEFYNKSPQWSPDGKKIVFASIKHGNFDIFVVSADGKNEKRLTFYSGNETPSSVTPDNKYVLFSASIMNNYKSAQYPGGFSELYKVPINGGKVTQVLSIDAEHAQYNKSQTALLYQDYKGYEDKWRKHHTSEVARDIMLYKKDGTFRQLTTYKCENRNAVFSKDEKSIYFLSEKSGSFNVYKMPIKEGSKAKQITFHKNHPVRFLSISETGTLCYAYNGKIYTQNKSAKKAKELKIQIKNQSKSDILDVEKKNRASEMAISPNGKEIAFIYRGDMFVVKPDSNLTKQITHTAEQERSVSFNADGRSLLYASERNGSWNIYESTIENKNEKLFFDATEIIEKTIVITDKEEFQPKYSPDNKEIAYLEERTNIKIKNLQTNKTRLVFDGKNKYSYADGDQKFEWSPNGKWLLYSSENNLFLSDIYLVNALKLQKPIDLTKSGYNDTKPKWGMNGELMMWTSDKLSMHKQAVWWGARTHIYSMFFNQKAYDVFKLSKSDYEKADKKRITYNYDEEQADYKNSFKRKLKLTDEGHVITDFYMTKNGEKLFYLVSKTRCHELWLTNVRDEKDSCVVIFPQSGTGSALWKNKSDNTYISVDNKEENIFAFIKGRIYKVNTQSFDLKPIDYNIKMKVDRFKERAYLFEHVWRQVKKKFYDKNLHNVDWDFYKSEYAKFLPYINNNFDFAEMLSELLGELNASHTGCRYYHSQKDADKTARLGLFLDYSYSGDGIKIDEVLEGGPFDNADSKVKKGTIILAIDSIKLGKTHNDFEFLNKKAGKKVEIEFYDAATKTTWKEILKPISIYQERKLLYRRWLNNRRAETELKSNGKVGYVHVSSMSDASLREVYSDALGLNKDKQALVIDTRGNGGGWLHDNLIDLFSGKVYYNFKVRGVPFGSEPMNKWTKKSILLMSEDNYSDANGFPYAYKARKIGKTVGKPVAGTMTAVWWERLMTGDFVFGIPQVGTLNLQGEYMENKLLEPDYDVDNTNESLLQGQDKQLEKAVELLMGD